MKERLLKTAAAIASAAILMLSFASCSSDEDALPKLPADYGTYGADFARELAAQYPCRKAFSDQEEQAGEMIEQEFRSLGYEVEKQTFSNMYGAYSANYIVRIEGDGFIEMNEDGSGSEIRKTVVIGAHYDNAYATTDLPSDCTYDGISDNASGIGVLMTIASRIQEYDKLGFDVILVAFGASSWDYMGARNYYNTLTPEEQASIEVMYCIESIYGGDKVYASSGLNSLDLSRKYAMRRKLYQAYDVAYDSMLASVNSFSLLYNESGIIADLNGDGVDDIFREVSNHPSDYVPFDDAGIPIVFFDSCDYFFNDLDDIKETKNLNLQEYGGKIRGTYLDSTEILDEVLTGEDGTDILEVRINNISYVILESMMKGSDYGMTHDEYDALMADIEAGLAEVSEKEDAA